jgi:type I restriction enzyme S subunit
MNLLLLRPAANVHPQFLHFLLTHLRELGIMLALAGRAVGQSSINQGRLKALHIPFPELVEQQQIAAVLSAVQRAIERQERLIALTTELKKALMHKLFTDGTRGEPLKQTEIGPVPKTWTVTTLGELCKKPHGRIQTGPFGSILHKNEYQEVGTAHA